MVKVFIYKFEVGFGWTDGAAYHDDFLAYLVIPRSCANLACLSCFTTRMCSRSPKRTFADDTCEGGHSNSQKGKKIP